MFRRVTGMVATAVVPRLSVAVQVAVPLSGEPGDTMPEKVVLAAFGVSGEIGALIDQT